MNDPEALHDHPEDNSEKTDKLIELENEFNDYKTTMENVLRSHMIKLIDEKKASMPDLFNVSLNLDQALNAVERPIEGFPIDRLQQNLDESLEKWGIDKKYFSLKKYKQLTDSYYKELRKS